MQVNLTDTVMPLSIDDWRSALVDMAPRLSDMTLSLPRNNPDYAETLETPLRVLNYLSAGDLNAVLDICKGYISFCDTFYEKQIEFMRSKHYKASDFEQVNADVYQNEEYMSSTYYPALLLSYLFSSNYFHIYRNFREKFLPEAAGFSGHACEVGIGHGMLSSTLLESNKNLRGYGLDISPVAVTVTERVSSLFGLQPAIEAHVVDATKSVPLLGGEKYAVMICAEVLEHIPDPAALIRNMRASIADGGRLFLTASMNMESVDHLYLFHSDDEVVEMVRNCGFEPIEREVAFLTVQPYRDNPDAIAKLTKRQNPGTAVLVVKAV